MKQERSCRPSSGRNRYLPSDDFDETYSETPIHLRDQQAKVFDLPQFVCQERAMITAGRTFTWGGRMKLQLPGYDPLRHKMLTTSQY
eukprot:CAMPEP_0196587000 /NCGR_PEP_ID=MMETSP1081-20130531/56135_1 /TAXON_ID=36882 /ORGANISM="Pyramimonas amylifera, Strain CCMP720" /LENGTH=86 /DNA_ID=CAMNT_0041909049 /DNA_START=316 /DNA_END=576 /DNA_ORIENTATION=+